MRRTEAFSLVIPIAIAGLVVTAGCRTHMPHALTWPAGGDIQHTHAKPPEGGYYKNWDPFAAELIVDPVKDVNPVRTQHLLVATVLDHEGKPLPNRRVEWMIAEGSVGDIVEVDESGWRASRGYKVDNKYAVSHTGNFKHVLDMGNDDPSDDVQITEGQTWCVITSPVEGDTHITAYAPGIYDWSKHKVFVEKHWYDVAWEFPPPDVNPIGTTHDFVTTVMKHSDGSPLSDYIVTYRILDGPPAVFAGTGGNTAVVNTNSMGEAVVTIQQSSPMEGINNVEVDIVRPADPCCTPEAHIATGMTSKRWIGPEIAISKDCISQALVDEQFTYNINVVNPSQVDATNVTVTDNIPDGIAYVSSSPNATGSGNSLSWSLGTLGAGQSTSITVTVSGTRTGTFENCASVTADYDLSDRDCCTTVISAPQLTVAKTCPAEVIICDTIEYVVTVHNPGDGPAQNVEVIDDLPDGIETLDGRRSVRATIGTLNPGETKTASFSAKANRTDSFVNVVRATADGLTAEAQCTTNVTQPVLQVTKAGPATKRYINRPFGYDITVSNPGSVVVRDLILTDTIESGVQFRSASDGGTYSGGLVTWNLGSLQPQAERKVSVEVESGRIGTVNNVATARGYCAEASANWSVEVDAIPAVLLEVVDENDPALISDGDLPTNHPAVVKYTITVTNQGEKDDTNIRVKAYLEEDVRFVDGRYPTPREGDRHVLGTDDQERTVITFPALPALAPRQTETFYLWVASSRGADTRIRVEMLTAETEAGGAVFETESTRFYGD